MPNHPRLVRRGSTYWHRAAVPVDIKSTYPKTEETFSLRTKDPREALILVRKAAAEVDERFAAHRRKIAGLQAPPARELTKGQLARLEEVYHAHLLEEDEAVRLDGFYEDVDPLPWEPRLTFEEREAQAREFGDDTRFQLARGKSDVFWRSEVEEVLTWDGLGIRLDPASASWKLAERALQSAAVRAHDDIARRNKGDVVPTPELPDIAKQDAHLASMVRAEWIAEKSKAGWVPKTRHEHEVWTQHFIDYVGDKGIQLYNKADARAFKQALQKLPPNWNKHRNLRNLSFKSAVARSSELQLAPMSDKNINKIMQFVGSLWLWAERHYDEVAGSPFKGLQIDIKQRARDDRDPFTIDQLRAIFNAPIYRGCRSASKWKHPGNEVLRDSGQYWVPLISLFSGARLGEIVQLRTTDVKEESGILYFDLQDEGEDQRLKNENSRRRIPVHPKLIELGLRELMMQRRTNGEVRLFPDLPLGKDGYYSSPFSKFYGRFLASVGAKGAKTSFHSFRHNFEDACRDAEAPPEVMNTLQGHGESGMAARYGKGYVLRKLDVLISTQK